MTRQQAYDAVTAFTAAGKAKYPQFADSDSFLLGRLEERAAQWLFELESLKAGKLEKEMDQLHKRLAGTKT